MSDYIPKILGVDFDDTLFLNSFPDNYAEPNWPVINYVKSRKTDGWYVILVTCRTNQDHINGAIGACSDVGLTFDAINENHPGLVATFGDCRKIFCDEYIDDKNVTIAQIAPTQLSMQFEPKKIVYISGKMRGLPNLGKDRFDAAEDRLKQAGFIVINPSVLPNGMDEKNYLPICMPMIDAADCIYMLNGWERSSGATAEYAYAVCQGKKIMFESEERALNGTEKSKATTSGAEEGHSPRIS